MDIIHGIEIADSYRYLETASAKTNKWITKQQQLSSNYFKNINNKQLISNNIKKLWNYETTSMPNENNNSIFYSYNSGLQNQAIIYMQDANGKQQEILDPNKISADGTVATPSFSVSDDGKKFAYAQCESGSDWTTWHFIDIASGEKLNDNLKWIKFAPVVWNADSSGVFYSCYQAPEENKSLTDINYYQKVYFHKIGTNQTEDSLIYASPENKNWRFEPQVTDDGNYLIIYVYQGTDERKLFFYKSLKNENSQVVKLIPNLEANYKFFGNIGTVFYFLTNYEAPNGKVIAIDINNSSKENWQTIISEQENILHNIAMFNQQIVTVYIEDILSKLSIYDIRGNKQQDIPLPGKGTITEIAGKSSKDYFYYSFSSYIHPKIIYKFNLKTKQSMIYFKPNVCFDSNNYVSEQVFYKSKDATKIPMMISYKKNMIKNSNNPTLVSAYGGFGISILPSFNPASIAWMDMGGICAIPNIRGGGEYGSNWHKDGMLDKKQNCFNDFYAAAEYLIDHKYTDRTKIGAYGSSNGGLLMGATLTQRPELFAAVIPEVAVLDMLRFQNFTVGHGWISEYGCADDADQFKTLYSYSPYHNISKRVYPATMLMTADHDDRVVPLHSFKFTALLQENQLGTAPIIIRIDSNAGHGSNKPTAKLIDKYTDIFSFLWDNFDLCQNNRAF